MSDGAVYGVKAGAALHAVLGGKEPESNDVVSDPAAFETWITGGASLGEALDAAGEDGYTETSRRVAKSVLAFLRRHPEHAGLSSEGQCAYVPPTDSRVAGQPEAFHRDDGWVFVQTEPGLLDPFEASLSDAERAEFDESTGFMWGWAVNAARRCLELPPVPNPALLTIG